MRTDKRIVAPASWPRFLRLAPAVLLSIVAASSHAGSNAVPDDAHISVTAVGGEVDFTMAGNAVEASPNDTVLLPARIVTGRDGSVGLTQAGTKVSIANDSDVEIPAEAVDGNLIARLVQHRGNVFYDVAPRDLGKLRVETPFLVAVIKGTQFNVAVDERGTTISLFEGSLEIRTPDDSDIIQLNAGEIAIRSLIDDSIRIIGMDDERVALPPAVQPSEDRRAAADDVAVAEEVAARADSSEIVRVEAVTPRVAALDAELGGVDLAADGPSIVMNTAVADVSVGSDVEDVTLDPGVGLEIDTGGADLRIDAGLDLADVVDAEPALDVDAVDAGASLTLDTDTLDATLDAGDGGLDLDLNIDIAGSKADVNVELEPGLRAPRALPVTLPQL
jgi:hypothetical protein